MHSRYRRQRKGGPLASGSSLSSSYFGWSAQTLACLTAVYAAGCRRATAGYLRAFTIAEAAGVPLPKARLTFASGAIVGLGSAHPKRGVALRVVESPYEVLGIQPGTSKADTRKFFRKLAQTEHPDVKQDDPDAPDRFQKLVDAYNAIMGDELLPDELLALRVKNTKRYQKKMKKEMDQGSWAMFMGNARLIQGIATAVFFGIVFALSTMSPEALEKLLAPSPQRF